MTAVTPEPIVAGNFLTSTLGLLVFLVGYLITRKVRFLRDYNIPEPVSGGILAALATLAIFEITGRPVQFEMFIRDYLLVLFFAGIGINARLRDLATGGKPLAILLVLTVILIVFQNLIGVGVAAVFGLPPQLGILTGSASLIGGHGTAIAWAPEIQRITGFAGTMELGVAGATIGLVIAALVGGPVAKYLIERNGLTPNDPHDHAVLGVPFAEEQSTRITPVDFMRVLLVLHVIIIIGYTLHGWMRAAGIMLPLFVPCMLTAIIVGNLLPVVLPKLPPVARTDSLSLISELSLGTFLAMSLMSMQLWTLQSTGLLMLVTMAIQTVAAVAFILYAVFPWMGGQYRAAVLSAGFAGFSLGATPTAIANMNAVTKRYGPSPVAFVILPLVSAFFVDLANAAIIQMFLAI